MTVMKSQRPKLLLSVFLLIFAMSQGFVLTSPCLVEAQDRSATTAAIAESPQQTRLPKSLLSFKFHKQQPSLIEKKPVAESNVLQNTGQNLPVVQASNRLPNGSSQQLQARGDAGLQQKMPSQSNVGTTRTFLKQQETASLEREIFNVNTPPTEYGVNTTPAPITTPATHAAGTIDHRGVKHAADSRANHVGNRIVSVNGSVPLVETGNDLLPEHRPLPLRKLSDDGEPSGNSIPSIAETEEANDVRPLDMRSSLPSTRDNNYSLVSNVQSGERTAVPASRNADTTSPSVPREINAADMRSAMLNGVQPGVTVKNEVLENMGPPQQVQSIDTTSEVLVYSLEELGTIEVTLQHGIVFSLVWSLPEPYPSEQIRRDGLGDELRGIRPIQVPDANNYILGQMFPEKGVIFSFVKADRPGVASLMVNQIAIEPVTSWPFELRGERYLTISNGRAKTDLTLAVQLDPNNDRARWLLAQAFLADGQLAEAQRECNFAIKLRGDQPQYNVTLAEIIGKAGYTKEARQYLEYLLPHCESQPYLKGRAECLLGDFYRDDSERADLISAKKYHLAAIETVTPFLNSDNPTIRQRAKHVQMNAFLSMALDISMSDWQDKEKNLPQWLDGAEKLANNLVIDENMSRNCLLDVAMAAISVYVNCPDLDDFDHWVGKLESITEELISQSDDDSVVQSVEKKLAVTLSHVEQICEYYKDYRGAMHYGNKALQYFERYFTNNDNVTELYRLGSLYYQLGRLEASGLTKQPPVQADKKTHGNAVPWFAKSIEVFQNIEASLDEYEQPVLGEIYVSIGVSYWMIGEKDYALQISEYGIGKLERAVDNELLDERVLATPYENLSTMYKNMGRLEEAENYYILSKQAGKNVASGSSSSTSTR